MNIWNNEYNRNFKFDGKEYCLQHLRPITFDVQLNHIGMVKVKVLFSTHVFTEKYKSYTHDPSLKVQFMRNNNNPDMRAFDLSRYLWSKTLAHIFENISPSVKIKNAGRGYYLELPSPMNYHIYFNLSYDNNNQVKLYVESAYCKRNTERTFERHSLKDCIRNLI